MEMPYIIVTQTNEDFLSKAEDQEDTLNHIIKTNVSFSYKQSVHKDYFN